MTRATDRSPSTWQLGADGLATQMAVTAIADQQDICALVWPWSETDSLRNYSEKANFMAAAERFLSLERGMLGRSAVSLPLTGGTHCPTGAAEACRCIVRWSLPAADPRRMCVGNPQTSDSNPHHHGPARAFRSADRHRARCLQSSPSSPRPWRQHRHRYLRWLDEPTD